MRGHTTAAKGLDAAPHLGRPSNCHCSDFQRSCLGKPFGYCSLFWKKFKNTSCISLPCISLPARCRENLARCCWPSVFVRQKNHARLVRVRRWSCSFTTGRASSQGSRHRCWSRFVSGKLDERLTRLQQEHGVLQHTVCIAVQVRVVVKTEPIQKFIECLLRRGQIFHDVHGIVGPTGPPVPAASVGVTSDVGCLRWEIWKVELLEHHKGVGHACPSIECRLKKGRSPACLKERLQRSYNWSRRPSPWALAVACPCTARPLR